MTILNYEPRQLACDKCGTIHEIATNHEGQIYNQKCKNWPCTPGLGMYTSMTFYAGEVERVKASFIGENGRDVYLLRAKK